MVDTALPPVVRHSSIATAVATLVVPGPTRTTRSVIGLQAALPSQTLEPSGAEAVVVHTVPGGRFGFEGVPFVQTSLVHELPSTGLSVSSGTEMTAPAPSQTDLWQLPGASVPAAVPAWASTWPQVWSPWQTNWRQAVSVPAQSALTAHCTQAALTQTFPPLAPEHDAPSDFVGCDGAPLEQTSSVQGFPSSAGTSVLSGADVMPPALSHTALLQLPVASAPADVPAASFANPQVFWLPQTRW